MTSSAGPSASATLDLFESEYPHGGQDESDIVLEGTLSSSSASAPGSGVSGASIQGAHFNTLDEPIKETILRDVRAVGQKFFHVLYPVEKGSLLKEWDLWGPLILCTMMATILQGHDTNLGSSSTSSSSSSGDGGPEFAEVFVVVWLGAMIVTLNTKLLGGNISFFQSVCVLGYCLLPLGIALIVCRLLLLAHQGTVLFLIRCVTVLLGFVWATYASMQFLGDCQPQKRKALAAYPMFLFYFLISWMVISHSN